MNKNLFKQQKLLYFNFENLFFFCYQNHDTCINSGERMFRIKQIEHQSLPGLQVYRRTTQGSAGYTEQPVVTFQSPEQETRTLSTKSINPTQ